MICRQLRKKFKFSVPWHINNIAKEVSIIKKISLGMPSIKQVEKTYKLQ